MKSIRVIGKRPGLFINNIRFYILLISLSLSILIVSLSRLLVESDVLFMIRTQQIYGFVALSLWYISLLATPVSHIVGRGSKFMTVYLFSRRALGVSGAYFALLHMLFGLFGQLGGLSGLLLLPLRFQIALWFGFMGLIVLLLMAVTSFDSVIRKMTFRRWKWLHRLSYPAIILVLAHVWVIGTHLEYQPAKLAILSLLSLLAILESWRISHSIEGLSGVEDARMRLIIFASLTVLFIGPAVYLPTVISRYHDSNHAGMHK